jgi:hypothetical protein
MNKPDFRDYPWLLDQQPDVGGTARLAEHAEQRAASTRKDLLLETMTALVVPASGEAYTTKVPFSANYSLVQLFRFAIATIPVCRSRFRLAHRHERTMRQ